MQKFNNTLLKSTVAVSLIIGATLLEQKDIIRRAFEKVLPIVEVSNDNSINTIRTTFKKEISQAIEDASLTSQHFDKAKKLEKELKVLYRHAPEYKKKHKELQSAYKEIDQATWYKDGSTSALIAEEANPFAKKLLTSNALLTRWSYLRARLEEQSIPLRYEHNLAEGYHLLSQVDNFRDRIEKNIINMRHREDFFLHYHDLFYAIYDEKFDPFLNEQKLQNILEKKCSSWEKLPATLHDDYESNNDTASFSIFEKNRIRLLIEKLNTTEFIESIFAERDKDIQETKSEIGGIIPLFDQGIVSIPPKSRESNTSYVPTIQREMSKLSSIAFFHFHADVLNNLDGLGPSYYDSESTYPGVVFTSIDKHTIAVHFYTSRKNPSRGVYDRLTVLSLGTITR